MKPSSRAEAASAPASCNDSKTTAAALPVFLTAAEAAEFLRLSEVSLARWRTEGRGPTFRKFSRRVVYSRDDLLAWAENQRRQSTSQQD